MLKAIAGALLRFFAPWRPDNVPKPRQEDVPKLPDPYAEFTRNDFEAVALQRIGLGTFATSILSPSVEHSDEVIVRIAKARVENASVEPPQLRRAINDLLTYFERRAKENRESAEGEARVRKLRRKLEGR